MSSGVHRRVSVDVRTGVMVNALQTLSKSQMTQQKRRTGRTDEGDQDLSHQVGRLQGCHFCVPQILWCSFVQRSACFFMEYLIQGE